MATLRAFVAVEPPATLVPVYQAARRFLADLDARLRWVRPEGVHLTLKFLGNVKIASVPVILRAMRAVAGRTPPMALRTSGVGAPNPDRARVVWLEVGGETAILSKLQADVEDAMFRIGFNKEERRFHPHLTLARARSRAVRLPSELTGTVPSAHFSVDRISLYSSELRPGGAVYNVLGHAPLSRSSGRG
ncbi:MAG: RNA 2',3'-cyclic phosphodiesterase [Gemmatimonadota bacterium]|nr:RNA 2',3'-cyclic phosphodiesterase [Gemmatimonadota bacterium]